MLPQTRLKSLERLLRIALNISALLCCQVVCYTSENREIVRARMLSSCLFHLSSYSWKVFTTTLEAKHALPFADLQTSTLRKRSVPLLRFYMQTLALSAVWAPVDYKKSSHIVGSLFLPCRERANTIPSFCKDFLCKYPLFVRISFVNKLF